MHSLDCYWVVSLSEVECTRGGIRWEEGLIDCRRVTGISVIPQVEVTCKHWFGLLQGRNTWGRNLGLCHQCKHGWSHYGQWMTVPQGRDVIWEDPSLWRCGWSTDQNDSCWGNLKYSLIIKNLSEFFWVPCIFI